MDIFINILTPILCLLFGYILGSIPFAVVIGKLFFHQDPRDLGSKNAGGTNAGRLWGKKIGVLVIILDMIKTIAPMYICWAILTFAIKVDGKPLCCPTEIYYTAERANYIIIWPVYLLANIGSAFGHCFPCFAKFKGGKAVSAFMGTLLGSSWGLGWVPASLFYFEFLKKTKYVSLTSMVFAGISVVVTWTWAILGLTNVIPSEYRWIVMYGPSINPSWHYALMITIIAILMVIRHKENIKRLHEGTERKIKWMK